MNDTSILGVPSVSVTPEAALQLAERPLLAVPAELRKPVFQVWAAFRHLAGMETPAPVAFLVSIWLSEHGVSPDVIRKSLAKLTAPKSVRNIRFASDLTASLAEMCSPPASPVVSSTGTPYEPYENFIPKPGA